MSVAGSPNSIGYAQPAYAPAETAPKPHAEWQPKLSPWKRFWRLKTGDKFLCVLGGLLLGYALGGRGFAYWGYQPVYVGEMTLFFGIFALLRSGQIWRVVSMSVMLPLMLFIIWGACRTIPFLGVYGPMAIRDAAIWGFAIFAFIVAALLIQAPRRLLMLIRYYKWFCYAFLILAPVAWGVYLAVGGDNMPTFPGGDNPIIQLKGGDTCVHIAGVLGYATTFGAALNPWLAPVLIPLNIGMNLEGRGGTMSFLVAAVLCFILRPFSPRIMRVFAVIALGLFFLWITDLRTGQNIGDANREISFKYLTHTFGNIIGTNQDEDLEGTKRWRLNWWSDIVNYAVFGEYKWTGKGYGINLADDDGYQLDGSLRSPHNGHMTILARSGLPGITLWAAVQFTWLAAMGFGFLKARRRHDWKWSSLFAFLLIYWAAFMTNATFDVFIEGPMGGIWLWVIYGTGIGSLFIYRHDPGVLYEQEDWDRANDRAMAAATQAGLMPVVSYPGPGPEPQALPGNAAALPGPRMPQGKPKVPSLPWVNRR